MWAVAGVALIGAIAFLAWLLVGSGTADQRAVSVGLYENPPKIYTGDDGEPTGLFPRVLGAVAADQGWAIDYVPCDWARCLEMVQSGELDLMPDVAWSSERDLVMDFPEESIANSWSQVYVRDDIAVESLADLQGLRIALLAGGIQEKQFTELMDVNGYSFTPVPEPSLGDAYRAVEEDEADAVVTNNFFAAWNSSDARLRETPIVFLPASLYVATGEGRNADLLEGLDASVAALKADPGSVYYEAQYGAQAGPPKTVLPDWLRYLLIALALGLVVTAVVSILLRWQVLRRSRALADSEVRYRTLETRDPLTGLPNRTLFMELLHREIEEAERSGAGLWLLVVDLHHFAMVNEVYGHRAGEALLASVGSLVESASGAGSLVGRTGDDEFSVLVNATPSAPVDARAERLLTAVQSPLAIDGETVVIGASVGISAFPDDGADAESLFRSAEAALRHAKQAGPGVFRFPSPEITEDARRRTALRAALRHAIDAQQFVMHYQPQVSALTGQIVGVEALVRWQHPERGLVPPGEFIGMAEESGDILPIGEWILRSTCRQVASWQAEGICPQHTAVNVSAAQLADTLFLDRVEHALQDAQLAPGLLELELTETAVMADREVALHTLAGLQRLGVRLSIDDFGVGYSSLSYLQTLPVDVLKVDLSFVHGMTHRAGDADIVRAIIALGHSLGLRIVAEGVETEQQRDLLREMNCDILQGYLISPPVPAEVMTALLREQRSAQP